MKLNVYPELLAKQNASNSPEMIMARTPIYYILKTLVMKIFTLSLSLLLLSTTLSSFHLPYEVKAKKKKNEMIDVNTAFQKVYEVTQQALSESNKKLLQVESIDLAFSTTTTYSTETGIKLWVISGSHSRSKGTTRTATFTFKEDENLKEASAGLDSKVQTFKEYLISVIKASESLEKVQNFDLSELQVQVEFTISRASEGGVEIELSPVTPSLSGKKEREYTHTITLTLKRKAKTT